MRRLAAHLSLAVTGALVVVPLTTRAADAIPGFGCTPIFNGGLVAEVCTSAMDGQAHGTLTVFQGSATLIELDLAKCNAAGTTCTVLATSTTTTTPDVPTKPGRYYRTCADFYIQVTPSDLVPYNGCSPLVQAPTPA